MYALCHAEYLVFMGRGRLSPERHQKAVTLRLLKCSGGIEPGADELTTVGFWSGLAGYREAVGDVYRLFD
jgi:hypothetical protein